MNLVEAIRVTAVNDPTESGTDDGRIADVRQFSIRACLHGRIGEFSIGYLYSGYAINPEYTFRALYRAPISPGHREGNGFMIRRFVLAATLLAPIASTAQELPTAPYLPLDLATKAAQAALEACVAEGSNVSVAVVARSGATQVLLKADNSGAHTGASAEGKAFTSAALGRDTAGVACFIAAQPANNGMRDMDPRLVIQAGGLPIKFGDALVAGIGVGGAPTGDIDAKCAAAGLKAIGAAE